MANELEEIHRSALELVRKQVERHSFGKLVFLSFIGTRPWGIAQENVDYDYRGIYIPKRGNHSITRFYVNNYIKDITMSSFDNFVEWVLLSNIHSLILINSPIIYANKKFLEFRDCVNSNFSKKVYLACQTKTSHPSRKDYLYDFFFIGNGISILEKNKVIANLPELNKKVLKILNIDKIIKRERASLPFKNKQICKKILNQLKVRLKEANKKSRLPEEINKNKFAKYV